MSQDGAAVGTTLDAPVPLPPVGAGAIPAPLQSMLSTAQLSLRPARAPDHAAENRALVALMEQLAISPEGVLRKLAETALNLCRAHTAGVSLLASDRKTFYWPAIAGQWAGHVQGGTPRDFGPCGTVLDRNTALMCSHPERDFPYFAEVSPLLEEALLIPFYVDGEAVGTLWVVAHDTSRRFDSEDLRLLNSLGTFAAAAYQSLQTLDITRRSASIVDSSDDAIVGKDLTGVIQSWNRGAERIFGYTAEEAVGRSITMLIPEQRLHEEIDILQRIGRGEHIKHYETVRQRKDGRLIDISLTISPIRNVEGRIVGASKIARDVTERKRAEAKITLLAREVDHRAKNLLALVQATVQLTQAGSAAEFKEAIQGRIQAIARVHTLLAHSRWSGADLHQLVREELTPFCHEDGRARIDGPSFTLEPSAAQAVAMIIHELATNAVKYGALSAVTGRVQVEWQRTGDSSLVLRWTETGGPPVKAPSRQGFGTRVVKETVRNQLNGEARFDWREQGLVCEITATQLAASP
jgi:PAS domain S-box-containing protein